jgi:hypothetical protein
MTSGGLPPVRSIAGNRLAASRRTPVHAGTGAERPPATLGTTRARRRRRGTPVRLVTRPHIRGDPRRHRMYGSTELLCASHWALFGKPGWSSAGATVMGRPALPAYAPAPSRTPAVHQPAPFRPRNRPVHANCPPSPARRPAPGTTGTGTSRSPRRAPGAPAGVRPARGIGEHRAGSSTHPEPARTAMTPPLSLRGAFHFRRHPFRLRREQWGG